MSVMRDIGMGLRKLTPRLFGESAEEVARKAAEKDAQRVAREAAEAEAKKLADSLAIARREAGKIGEQLNEAQAKLLVEAAAKSSLGAERFTEEFFQHYLPWKKAFLAGDEAARAVKMSELTGNVGSHFSEFETAFATFESKASHTAAQEAERVGLGQRTIDFVRRQIGRETPEALARRTEQAVKEAEQAAVRAEEATQRAEIARLNGEANGKFKHTIASTGSAGKTAEEAAAALRTALEKSEHLAEQLRAAIVTGSERAIAEARRNAALAIKNIEALEQTANNSVKAVTNAANATERGKLNKTVRAIGKWVLTPIAALTGVSYTVGAVAERNDNANEDPAHVRPNAPNWYAPTQMGLTAADGALLVGQALGSDRAALARVAVQSTQEGLALGTGQRSVGASIKNTVEDWTAYWGFKAMRDRGWDSLSATILSSLFVPFLKLIIQPAVAAGVYLSAIVGTFASNMLDQYGPQLGASPETIADAKTSLAVLGGTTPSNLPTFAPYTQNEFTANIIALKTKLKSEKLYAGEVNGNFGTKEITALQEALKNYEGIKIPFVGSVHPFSNIPVDGTLNPQTMTALVAASKARPDLISPQMLVTLQQISTSGKIPAELPALPASTPPAPGITATPTTAPVVPVAPVSNKTSETVLGPVAPAPLAAVTAGEVVYVPQSPVLKVAAVNLTAALAANKGQFSYVAPATPGLDDKAIALMQDVISHGNNGRLDDKALDAMVSYLGIDRTGIVSEATTRQAIMEWTAKAAKSHQVAMLDIPSGNLQSPLSNGISSRAAEVAVS